MSISDTSFAIPIGAKSVLLGQARFSTFRTSSPSGIFLGSEYCNHSSYWLKSESVTSGNSKNTLKNLTCISLFKRKHFPQYSRGVGIFSIYVLSIGVLHTKKEPSNHTLITLYAFPMKFPNLFMTLSITYLLTNFKSYVPIHLPLINPLQHSYKK